MTAALMSGSGGNDSGRVKRREKGKETEEEEERIFWCTENIGVWR